MHGDFNHLTSNVNLIFQFDLVFEKFERIAPFAASRHWLDSKNSTTETNVISLRERIFFIFHVKEQYFESYRIRKKMLPFKRLLHIENFRESI